MTQFGAPNLLLLIATLSWPGGAGA